ncbi:MarR family transcriptional regulator [Clostridium grantii]|uniref:DNA-binding transcriptional regulator, MarR family n=1 Tax=Clostridium grantii DSM 8605 TaxID=1121316 RepID=A0A1M5WRX4_9CLOT|nr:MarR family transcriptional regulator [Clostridium grantii]SHH89864.1 DNA-binding transcriptional regulator, MarR family [Clostridium grantii DSM 8605]
MKAIEFGSLIRGITANVNYFIGLNIEQYGIKQGQYEYFLLIFNIPGINQLEIGRIKKVGKASVTKALKKLEEDNFIRREVDQQDKRNFQCYVTEKGEKIIDELMLVKKNVEEDLFHGFSEEDKTCLYNYLTLLHNNSEKLANSSDK